MSDDDFVEDTDEESEEEKLPKKTSLSFWEQWKFVFECQSSQELVAKLEPIHKKYRPFDDDTLGFTAEDFDNIFKLGNSVLTNRIKSCLIECWGAIKTEELIKDLRINPPKESYGNPSNFVNTEVNPDLMNYLLLELGLDLPASKYNPIGMGYFSGFFYDMFFGNYEEFEDHIDSLSEEDLKKTLDRREGYFQFSPLFAPIIGRKMVNLEEHKRLSPPIIKEVRTMWNGTNENRHFKILDKLLQLGADPNAYDRGGFTGLFHACFLNPKDCVEVMKILLKHGADINFQVTNAIFQVVDSIPSMCVSRFFVVNHINEPEYDEALDLLLKHNPKPRNYIDIIAIRIFCEVKSTTKKAAKLRQHFPKNAYECERTGCRRRAPKRCTACASVYYCSQKCQQTDWKFHKLACKKKKAAATSV